MRGPLLSIFPLLASLYIFLCSYSEKKEVLVVSGLTELGQNLGLATQPRFYPSNKVLQSHWARPRGA